jgi:prevent-host-death family protein
VPRPADPTSERPAPARLGARQVRADIAAVLRRAEAGERIVVTVDGRPVATIGPLSATAAPDTTADELVVRGLLIPPRRRDPFRAGAPVPTWRGARLERLLDELR